MKPVGCLTIAFKPRILFQFLWGWNLNVGSWSISIPSILSIPLRMKRNVSILSANAPASFNSFEDETSENSRRRGNGQFATFNSFEDETNHFIELLFSLLLLSIPLRMKHDGEVTQQRKVPTFNSFEDETYCQAVEKQTSKGFQFLWGWNLDNLTITKACPQCAFNSFEDKTRSWSHKANNTQKRLSIPLRMKQLG